MTDKSSTRVFESDLFTIDHNDACGIPGYLILRVNGPATSLSELNAETAGALGELLARAVRAIERTVSADRVYCLTFAEMDRRLHFHLFPRTAWLLDEYWRATGSEDEPINGPVLFEWARTAFGPDASLPAQARSVAIACLELHGRLGAHEAGEQ